MHLKILRIFIFEWTEFHILYHSYYKGTSEQPKPQFWVSAETDTETETWPKLWPKPKLLRKNFQLSILQINYWALIFYLFILKISNYFTVFQMAVCDTQNISYTPIPRSWGTSKLVNSQVGDLRLYTLIRSWWNLPR